jgi:predicted acetyltransferase
MVHGDWWAVAAGRDRPIRKRTMTGNIGAPRLVEPTTRLRTAWRTARDDWGPGIHEDGFGLGAEDDVETDEGFAAWVRRMRPESDATVPPTPGQVPGTCWWIVEEAAVLGGIAMGYQLNERALRVGQIGYGIRPSARGRGLAKWALGQVLLTAATNGLDRVLITCRDDNVASARVIEHNGGLLENVRGTGSGRMRRYWVMLA